MFRCVVAITLIPRHQGIDSKGMDEFYYILVYGSKIAYFEFKMMIYEHIADKNPFRMGNSTSLDEIRN